MLFYYFLPGFRVQEQVSGTGTHIHTIFCLLLLFSPHVYIIWTGFVERIGIYQASKETRGFSGLGSTMSGLGHLSESWASLIVVTCFICVIFLCYSDVT